MKKTIYTLLIMIMTSLNIIAKNNVIELEKFEIVEMNVKAKMLVIRSANQEVLIPDTTAMKYLDLKVVDNTLKVNYKKAHYKEVVEPVTIVLKVSDSIKVTTTRDYKHTVKKTID